MHPVERSLYVGEAAGFQMTEDVRVGSDAEPDAINYAGKAHVRFREHINVSRHPRHNILKRAFAEITNRPPGARINKREHLLPHMRVGALRDIEICHARVERRIDPAVVEVVTGAFHSRRSRATLVDERFKRSYGMYGLFVLGLALSEDSCGVFVLRHGRL